MEHTLYRKIFLRKFRQTQKNNCPYIVNDKIFKNATFNKNLDLYIKNNLFKITDFLDFR